MIIKVSESKAYRIQLIRMHSAKGDPKNPVLLSIRQLYKTKKSPEWKPAYQGITFPMDIAARVIKGLIKVFKDKDQEVEVIKKKESK
jgi:hypothetical protein